MKYFATVIVLTFVAVAVGQDGLKLSAEQKEKVHLLVGECAKETGVSKEAILALRQGDFSQVDDKVKCFSKCYQERLGYLVNGVVNEEAVQKSLGPLAGEEQIKAVQAKCNGVKGANDCETAFELYKCYYGEKATVLA
ncbi:PREDICTED: general odorant-binding protein 56d-like [Rhagoletis zephyria]|uniref:general odorant-binding protein 56d-like n=1 Tax=Rhagoletis zephyria TaxID=28612 RepID=UPI0008117A36|nr:PREDICTED: general odorant-binding protein 56d-like [Rhagoletis zephyria]